MNDISYADYMEDNDYWETRRDPVYKELVYSLDHAQDHMKGLYAELSADTPVDLDKIYFHIGEICSALNVDDKKFADINITRNNQN